MSRAVACALAVLLGAAAARAQTLSPGKLGRSHAELEGISNCTKCHEFGKQMDGRLCLDCHKQLKQRMDAKQGLHGRLEGGGVGKCMDCHRDHRGVDAALTEFGAPTKRGFDHRRTGWPLEGRHASAKCEACHEVRRVQDPQLKKHFGANKSGTYLGLETRCAGCHFDDHRGQFQGACDRCHDAKAFKPAPKFSHDEPWKLLGKHAQAKCQGCHPRLPDAETRGAFPPPVDAVAFTRFVLPDKNPACKTCHFDEHRGQLGLDCARCHDSNGFKPPQGFSHDAAWKLTGAHARVACAKCHPNEPDTRSANAVPKPVRAGAFQRFKPLEKRCVSCHRDVHDNKFGPDCARCHNERSWQDDRAVQADPAFHDSTRYPLLGKHRAAQCSTCHPPNAKGGLVTKGLPFQHCGDCHADAHLGQLPRDA